MSMDAHIMALLSLCVTMLKNLVVLYMLVMKKGFHTAISTSRCDVNVK
jgi:hypothetical protein